MRPAGIRRLRLALSIIGAAALAACSGPAASSGPAATRHASPPEPTYYLALGDSLAQGVQPNAAGTSVETRAGYPDQVYAALRPGHRALAEWRQGLSGHLVAWTAERLAASYNNMLGRVYTRYGARVANVFGAFETADFAAQGTTPRNVTLLCQWTWECAAPPRGPNQHANQAGYHVIARTFLQAVALP